jgi:hypothetical protein
MIMRLRLVLIDTLHAIRSGFLIVDKLITRVRKMVNLYHNLSLLDDDESDRVPLQYFNVDKSDVARN